MNYRGLRSAGPVLLIVAALVALFWALWVGGGAAPLVLGDPGPGVRWGLPVTTLLVNLSAAGTVGPLVLALFASAPTQRPFEFAVTVASFSAAVFTVSAGVTGFLTFVDVTGAAPSAGPVFGEQLGSFLTGQELGRTWLFTTLAGAVVTLLLFAVRSWTPTLLVTILALVTLVPMGTQGHSGELATHNIAMTALILHMIAAAVWLGGLVFLVIARPTLPGGSSAVIVARYSSIALAAFVVVLISGFARAVVDLGSWTGLVSGYGMILVVKVIAFAALGVFGAWYRRRLIPRLDQKGAARPFWQLVGIELVLMGLASGAAAALARTAPPADDAPPARPTPAEILTSAPLPPEFVPTRWLTAWSPDLLWVLVVGFGLFFYLAGVRRLYRRGDTWPVYRTTLWVTGMLALLWVTCGPVYVYQDYLFSVHMLGHMFLTMVVPLALVPGAPVTLAARAIRKRSDGTRGGREWILWAVHTPFARVVSNPVVAAAIFVASLWLFYYTDLFRWSLYDHLGHEWMTVHFLISGYLLVQSLVGIDPVPFRLSYPFRLILLIAVLGIHAIFGLAVMTQTGLFVAEWFGSMGRTWGPTPLEDQYVGGGAAWSVGEIPTLILAITVAVQWSRSDDRAQRRRDRHVDRVGDAELDAYNAHLAALAERDARDAAHPRA